MGSMFFEKIGLIKLELQAEQAGQELLEAWLGGGAFGKSR